MQVFKTYLNELLPAFEYTVPEGGMFIYGKLPGISTSALVESALKQGVVFVPGREFYHNPERDDEIRLNFTNCSAKEVYKGLTILAKIYKKEVQINKKAA